MIVGDVIVLGFEVVGNRLVDLGVMVLELDSSFGGCYCFKLGGAEEWTYGRVVSMVDVTGGF